MHKCPMQKCTRCIWSQVTAARLPAVWPGSHTLSYAPPTGHTQLDCTGSPACVWRPEANQCGFAPASSALE
ncbi:hypothetical protein O181_091139 [Austropuccinia psidii MF-1]|uniref:Uncharacterized protein n=1 Tax=Austropuccinia psidii MF-1 TaxID=1389203 RepID=A0A9Q3IWY8_9BASI|nr:hypothetical protein [Austropuccinia psidii MF-1]